MRNRKGSRAGRRRGVALLMVLVVMAVLCSWAAANGRTLAHLRRFLTQVNRDQVEKFEPPAKETPAPGNKG